MTKFILLSLAILSVASCRNFVIPLFVDHDAPTETPQPLAENSEKES